MYLKPELGLLSGSASLVSFLIRRLATGLAKRFNNPISADTKSVIKIVDEHKKEPEQTNTTPSMKEVYNLEDRGIRLIIHF